MYSKKEYEDSLKDPDESRRGRARLQLNGKDLVVRIRAYETTSDEVWIEGGEPAGVVQVAWELLAPMPIVNQKLVDLALRLDFLVDRVKKLETDLKHDHISLNRIAANQKPKPRKRRR